MKKSILVLFICLAFILSKAQVCSESFQPMGLSGILHSVAFDSIGKWHNDYLDFIIERLRNGSPNYRTSSNLKKFIIDESIPYWAKKGITTENYPFIASFDYSFNPPLSFVVRNDGILSQEALEILQELKKLQDQFQEQNDAIFFEGLDKLKERALALPNETEKFKVGSPVMVAIYSYNFWKLHQHHVWQWFDNIAPKRDSKTGGNPTMDKQFRIGWGSLGAADLAGGYAGAVGGSALGPGGALAGGVCGAAVGSIGNLAGQVIGHFCSWW
jgi:hypothetical protein